MLEYYLKVKNLELALIDMLLKILDYSIDDWHTSLRNPSG